MYCLLVTINKKIREIDVQLYNFMTYSLPSVYCRVCFMSANNKILNRLDGTV